ncbi:MAG: M1 family aminopeptidase [Bryobacteraceae bacterium]|jgi:tetratricopeptide (TPR) repeat protein
MSRKLQFLTFVALLAAVLARGQERQAGAGRIDIDHYKIDAEINPRTQSIAATVEAHFSPVDNNVTTVAFELNNALNVTRVVDDAGRQIPASRSQQDFTLRLTFPEPLIKGKASTVTFTYDGRLAGTEDSPVYGIRFAAIHNDFAYLMYPARWFPISGYTTDRFAADTSITVPNGYDVLASGIAHTDHVDADRTVFSFHYARQSFPGSIAVVQGQPVKVNSEGVVSTLYFRTRANMASAYGEEAGKIMSYFTSLYGLPPQANLTFVETEDGTPNGYSGPGLVFLSPGAIGNLVAKRVLANQLARQWWGMLISPPTRNSLWLSNGSARYAELLYVEHDMGNADYQAALHDDYVDALSVESPPVAQSGRLEDYSVEYWAVTAGKGAAFLNMLRLAMGDQNFFRLLKGVPDHYAWKTVSTRQFEDAAEQVSGEKLDYLFLQWIDSSGAPEFKLEYTVFRTAKGFRVMGKVAQDLDTFRMPVTLHIETEGNPEEKQIEVVGTSSEFSVDTFGKPKVVTLDPKGIVLRYTPSMRVAVAIRRGEQFAEIAEYAEAQKEYQKALEVQRNSSMAHYRVGELFFQQNNYQSAANEFREALNGDLEPRWIEVWAHINLGKIFDVTSQRERAVSEYHQAVRTKDNTQNAQEEAAKYLKAPYERKRSDQ